jgi:hypothetical protein
MKPCYGLPESRKWAFVQIPDLSSGPPFEPKSAHGVSADLAREFFEQFQWEAIPHPVEPGAPPWDPSRWVIERWFRGHLYRMVFLMDLPPGTEATLVTFFPENTA